jgi:UDP-N-acetylglucosamine 2-epimerase
VPTVAIQHGIVYPKYFSYRHDPDEAECPRPDRTAVFGEAARRLLVTLGGYAPESLVTTGSPRFDELLHAAREWDREAARRERGVADGERLVVIASRFRAIRDTHHSIGSAFAGLVRAIEALPDVRAIVKPHPAESREPYAAVLRETGATRVALVEPQTDLLRLLHASDALVTVESLSAVEALVLGRPVLVLNLPTHLSYLVDAGVALGVPAGGDPAPALRDALTPGPIREGLDRARASYLSELAMGVDGGATARIVALLRETAAGPAMVASGARP